MANEVSVHGGAEKWCNTTPRLLWCLMHARVFFVCVYRLHRNKQPFNDRMANEVSLSGDQEQVRVAGDQGQVPPQ